MSGEYENAPAGTGARERESVDNRNSTAIDGTRQDVASRLHPDHLADLLASGLTHATIAAAGVYSLRPADIPRALGWDPPGVVSALHFPYPGCNGFARVKVFPPLRDGDGHTCKYLQPPKTPPRLYVPPGVEKVLTDAGIPLDVTEGEKKSLAGAQSGRPCVGIGGLWSWTKGGQAIADLNRAAWAGRKVRIVPDSDVWSRPDLLCAVYALGAELESRGATVEVVQLPGGDDPKTGLDDFLRAHKAEDLDTLPRFNLKHATFTRARAWHRGWSAKHRVETAAGGDKLQGRAVLFPPVEPWPEPVDGTALLDDLRRFVRRFVVLPRQGDIVGALWALHTWVFDSFVVSPRLAVTSPAPGCGKTLALDVLALLASRPLRTDNLSAAVLFRVVQRDRPALLADEADCYLGDRDELRGLLNSGHRRGGVVLRCEGESLEPRAFAVFGPCAVAMIGRLPPTLHDRAIELRMARRLAGEAVQSFRPERVAGEAEGLRRRAARWAADHAKALAEAEPEIPPGIENRAADNWRPLLAIADAAGGDWPRLAREAAAAFCGAAEAAEDAAGVMLLEDMRALFAAAGVDRLASEDVCGRLAKMEDRPWPEWKHGNPVTPRQLAKLLTPYDIRPRSVRFGGESAKGYHLADLADAFGRYLRPPPHAGNGTPAQSPLTASGGPFDVNSTSGTEAGGDGSQFRGNGPESLVKPVCAGVPDRGGGSPWTPSGPCRRCKGREFWATTREGEGLCQRCRPCPLPRAEVFWSEVPADPVPDGK